MQRIWAVVVVLVAGLALVACGGEDKEQLSADEYRGQSQSISDNTETKLQTGIEKARSDDPEESLAGVKEIGATSDEAAQELNKLEPPDEFKDVHERLTSTLSTVGDRADAFEQAIAAKDKPKAEQELRSFQQSLRDLDRVGDEYDKKVGTT